MEDFNVFAAQVLATEIFEAGPFSTFPTGKPVESIRNHLSLEDIKNCRLACRPWNLAFSECVTFTVKLSDMTILPFLRIRRSDPLCPKLHVTKITTVDLSPLSAPFTSVTLQEQLHYPEEVKVLVFQEGVSSLVKQNFLLAYKWIDTLQFEKTPIPLFPQDLVLEYLTKFEMCPGSYSESEDLQLFFRKTFFPSLKETCIQIHCRTDYRLYAVTHFFIARHHKSLRTVKLMFLESLTLLGCFDMQAYAKDIQEVLCHQRREIENDTDYMTFLDHVSQLRLDVLNLWLMDNEETLTLSLQLIEQQKTLSVLDVNHQYGYRNTSSSFGMVLRANSSTLRKVTIPRLSEFDCSFLKNCSTLQEFSIGLEFHFYDFENYGSIINVKEFPTSSSVKSVSMGSPMLKEDILWMLNNVPAKTFLFIGSLTEEFTVKDVKAMVESGPADKKALMMCIPMSHSVFKRLESWLNKQADIGIRVIYHCKPTEKNPGTAHISLCFGLQTQGASPRTPFHNNVHPSACLYPP